MTVVELTIPGDPVPLERAGRRPGGGTYLPARSEEFRGRIQAAWLVEGRPRLEDRWLELTVCFYYQRPKSHTRAGGRLRDDAPRFPPRGDTSNLVKAVEDALQDQGGGRLLYPDDVAIVRIRADRLYADRGQEAHTVATFRPVGM